MKKTLLSLALLASSFTALGQDMSNGANNFYTSDKVSVEKENVLKAYGAEVVRCPTAVEPEDPRSYYKVAERLASEIPGGFVPNQYGNPNNPLAHYQSTGPEVWAQTDGRITAFVAGMGTGGRCNDG